MTPTSTPSPTATGQGPAIAYFAIVSRFDGCIHCCEIDCQNVPTPVPQFENGRQVFTVMSGQFIIVIEGRPGLSFLPVATSLIPRVDGLPDLWVQSSQALGNGSATVCDTGPPSAGGGGIPGVSPARFDFNDPMVADAVNDFACRFDPSVSPSAPCTILDVSREPRLVTANSTAQFCDVVAATAAFPTGDTILSAVLRDSAGNTGPTAQIVVRVATPTPTQTPPP